MSQSIDVTEDNQQHQLLKFTEDIPKAIDASLGDIKLKLDLSDETAQTSLNDSIVEVPKENPSSLIEDIEEDNVVSSLTENLQARPNEHDYCSTKSINTRKTVTLWVSNISRNLRANDLKKHFSKSANVLSAKILTNGKGFYGCVSLETCDQANECLKELNNSVIEGNVIHVSKNRPDMRKNLLENKSSKSKVRRIEIYKDCKDQQLTEKESGSPEKNIMEREIITEKRDESKKLISDLERRLKNAQTDLSRMKRKLDKYEIKNSLLEKNSRKEMEKIRSERRRLNQDKENFEKTKRDFQKEMTNEKASVLKELDEARALRIKLQNRLDNFLTSTPRSKRKSRSPLTRNARNNIGRTFADDTGRNSKNREWRSSKRPRKENPVTIKVSPPSPPRLSEFDRRGSQHNEHFLVKRPYYSDERHHTAPEMVNFRQKLTFDNFPRENRNSYPMTYVKDDPKHQGHTQSFPNDRFGNPMQTSPQMLGPSRVGNSQYVNEFGKHYIHY